ncbi:MAG: UrcA family protein [Pseudomonadota bacterium]
MKIAALGSCLAFAVAGIILPTAAHADQTVTTEIAFDRTQLETAQGARTVYSEIRRQARSACKVQKVGYSAIAATDFNCMADLVDQAVGKINAPELSALHDSAMTGQVFAQN